MSVWLSVHPTFRLEISKKTFTTQWQVCQCVRVQNECHSGNQLWQIEEGESVSVWVGVHPTFRLEISKKYLYYTVAAVSVCQGPKRVPLWESVMADRAGRVGVSVGECSPNL